MWEREGEAVNNSVINAELAMQKVYDLRALCMKIWAYWCII